MQCTRVDMASSHSAPVSPELTGSWPRLCYHVRERLKPDTRLEYCRQCKQFSAVNGTDLPL
ncbi:hypothetical protein IF1G_08235 [Cordyceps javanica]|uniref:Uncharacterized protein n=1 Tax=Cordyceps javanica TaxID=43265 RepID=A0A545UTY2_9HYPO|nr:hypothetical protein IF1G_08235 [Cordyceps javanica]